MRTFVIDTIPVEGVELDESRLARIVGGLPKSRDDRERTGCTPDSPIRGDDPILH